MVQRTRSTHCCRGASDATAETSYQALKFASGARRGSPLSGGRCLCHPIGRTLPETAKP